jgi:hypothetical protein
MTMRGRVSQGGKQHLRPCLADNALLWEEWSVRQKYCRQELVLLGQNLNARGPPDRDNYPAVLPRLSYGLCVIRIGAGLLSLALNNGCEVASCAACGYWLLRLWDGKRSGPGTGDSDTGPDPFHRYLGR